MFTATTWVARGSRAPKSTSFCILLCHRKHYGTIWYHLRHPTSLFSAQNLVVLSWNCSSTETSSLKKRQGEVLHSRMDTISNVKILEILGFMPLWQHISIRFQVWPIWGQPGESPKPKWWGGERGCGNWTGTLCLPAQLIYADSGLKKCWVESTCSKERKIFGCFSCWWYRLCIIQSFLKVWIL